MKNKFLVGALAVVAIPSIIFLGGCDEKPVQDGSSANPYLITSVDDFENIALNATKGYTYKLTNNINLNNYDDAFSSQTYIMEHFKGTIDGNGKTITMPNYSVEGTEHDAYVFSKFDGVLKNVTLHFNNVNVPATWANINTANGSSTYDNVKTTGTINVPFGTTNYSPLQNFTRSDITFKDCVNNADILGLAEYGSAFLGGYSTNNDAVKTFTNCVNNANIVMRQASMLQGNSTYIYTDANTKVTNCKNNGKVIGLASAGLYSGMASTNSADMLETLNGQVTGIPASVRTSNTTSLSLNSSKKFVIENTNHTNANNYIVQLRSSYNYVSKTNSDDKGTAVVTITYTSNATGVTPIKNLQFIDNAKYKSLVGDIRQAVEGVQVFVNGKGEAVKLWEITHGDTHYYYVEITEDKGYTYSFGTSGVANSTAIVLTNQNNMALSYVTYA